MENGFVIQFCLEACVRDCSGNPFDELCSAKDWSERPDQPQRSEGWERPNNNYYSVCFSLNLFYEKNE